MTVDRAATREQLRSLRGIRGIRGQVRSSAAMVEQEQCCIEVRTQVSTPCRGLQWVALALLDEQVGCCAAAWDAGEWQ